MPALDLRDVDAPALPRRLAEEHQRLPGGARIELSLPGTIDERTHHDLIVGAGFDPGDERGAKEWDTTCSTPCVRLRTLPDTVDPDMRLLVCGLNPSLHAADAGVGFVSPSNRFWPAAVAAGLVSVDRDPFAALDEGVGMTDVVKRATTKAAELAGAEYVAGLARLDRLCQRLKPAAVCMVGLAGWRAAADRKATAGWQERTLGGRPVYVMPSTSGLNAHARLDDLVDHLRRAARA